MKLYMAAILAISFLDIFNESIVRGSFGSQMVPKNRCVDLHTNEIDIKRITGYEEHTRPLKVVIFLVNDRFRVCVPHDLQWVRNTIKKLNQRPPKGRSPSRRRAGTTSRPKARTT